jgi:hypothetical protein
MGSLFGCGPAVVALTTGLPLPIISAAIVRGGHDPEAIRASELASVCAKLGWRMSAVAWWSKRCSGPTVAAWAQVTPWIERGTQFVAWSRTRRGTGAIGSPSSMAGSPIA